MNDKTKVIETILKLSAIVDKDSGAFQGEISAAASKIQLLMDKYAISQSEVDEFGLKKSHAEMKREFMSKTAEHEIKGIKRWHWDLAGSIADITNTRHYSRSYRGRGHMVFFGEKESAQIASSLYVEWVVSIEAMAEQALKEHWKFVMKEYDYAGFLQRKKELGYGREEKFQDEIPAEHRTTYFKSSWLLGCVREIQRSAREAREQRDAGTATAIVLVNTEVNKRYAELSKDFTPLRGSSSPSGFSELGYARGMKTGSNIAIGAKKVGGGK